MPTKCGCLCSFVTKKPCLGGSLCQLTYEDVEHVSKHGEPCHENAITSFRHALDSNISNNMKLRIEHVHIHYS